MISVIIAVTIFQVEIYTEKAKLEMEYLRKINTNIRLYTDSSTQISIDNLNSFNYHLDNILIFEKEYNLSELKNNYRKYVNNLKITYLSSSINDITPKMAKLSQIENNLFFDFIAFQIYSNNKQNEFNNIIWDIIEMYRNENENILNFIKTISESPNHLDKINSINEAKLYLHGLQVPKTQLLSVNHKKLLNDLFSIRLHLLNQQHEKLNENIFLQIKKSFLIEKVEFIPKRYLYRKLEESTE